jgi:hypothetical protein
LAKTSKRFHGFSCLQRSDRPRKSEKFPVLSLFNREFDARDGFDRDCPLRQSVRDFPDFFVEESETILRAFAHFLRSVGTGVAYIRASVTELVLRFEIFQQRLGFFQVSCVEAFGEPAVDFAEYRARLFAMALFRQELCESYSCVQFV